MNPLLEDHPLPPFSRIRPEHVGPAVDVCLAENRSRVAAIVGQSGEPGWEDTFLPLEALADRLNRLWSPVAHLHAVADSEPLREVYAANLAKVADYGTELAQDAGLCARYEAFASGPAFAALRADAQRSVRNALRDFRLSGVSLPAEGRDRVRAVRQALTRAQTRFQQNLLDATQAWKRLVTDRDELAGLSEAVLALLAQNASRAGREGWLLTLDFPCYHPVMTSAANRALREEIHRAWVTRASELGPAEWDNGPVMTEILELRAELARLVGFPHYAEYSLATKMAGTPAEVLGFLEDLARRARPYAFAELAEVEAHAAAAGAPVPLQPWDVAYWSERLRESRYALSQDALRPWFPLPRVRAGLFEVVRRLFGLTVSERPGVDVWHPDVSFHEVHDAQGELRGMFYLDPYARPGKRGGAWMDECRVRRRDGRQVQLPVAYLTCNFTPPVGDAPALLTHDEVVTLFHEFGHGLHHMLTRIDLPSVAGINGVAWDAVELPSQFMENWCWEAEAIPLISGHWQTGEPLAEEVHARMRAARTFQAGLHMVRQLEFALFDFRLHMQTGPFTPQTIQQTLDAVRDEVAVVPRVDWNRFQHSFAHVFAGGYAAGYYSYKWAEVLAADAYALFEEHGAFHRPSAERFMHAVLEQGGARDAMDLYREFRGREPSLEPLLRRSGLAA